MRERREARPEIVERKLDALVLEAGDDGPRKVEVGEQRALGDLDHQALGGEACVSEGLDDSLSKPAVGELEGRDVDRNFQLGIPAGRLGQRLADHMLGKSADQADLLRDRDEDIGSDHSRKRVDPARQNLEAHNLSGGEVNLGLKIGDELAMLETHADALLDLAVGDERALHARVEPHRPRDPAAPGMIHRDVGAPEHVWDAALLAGADAMPVNAPTWMIRSSNSRGRVTIRSTASAISSARFDLVRRKREGDGELVAAEAGKRRVGAQFVGKRDRGSS